MNHDIVDVYKIMILYTRRSVQTVIKEPVDVWSAAGVSHSLPVVRILYTLDTGQCTLCRDDFMKLCVFNKGDWLNDLQNMVKLNERNQPMTERVWEEGVWLGGEKG